MSTTTRRMMLAPTLMVLAISGTACAHVSQEDLDGRLTTLREDMTREMQEGDEGLRSELGRRMDAMDDDMAALRADLEALEQEFDVTVQEFETAIRFNTPVYFQFDDAEVQPQGRDVLDRFADVAQKYYPGAQITVEGFTDPSGDAAYNLRLGARRAEAVQKYIVGRGLQAEQVRSVSYGEDTSRLIIEGAKGPGTQGWQNRRVVLVIDHGGAMPARAVVAGESGSGG